MRRPKVAPASIYSLTILIMTLIWPGTGSADAQQELELPTPPKQQNARYVGLTKCAACHFEKYKDWKTSEHGNSYGILPLKYRNDASCLKCHVTGIEASSHLIAGNVAHYEQGVTCEACHGPGSEHADLALRFVSEQRIITEEGLRQLREKIHRLDMLQCVNCHVSKAHKKHPEFDRDALSPRVSQQRKGSFFQSVHSSPTGNAASTAPN